MGFILICTSTHPCAGRQEHTCLAEHLLKDTESNQTSPLLRLEGSDVGYVLYFLWELTVRCYITVQESYDNEQKRNKNLYALSAAGETVGRLTAVTSQFCILFWCQFHHFLIGAENIKRRVRVTVQ